MNIVIISACTPREKLVVHQVIKSFPNVTVIHPDSNTTTSMGRKTKERFWDFWGKKIINFLRKKIIEKITQNVSLDPSTYNRIEFDHSKLKTEEGVELLEALKPDILVTCNAPILRDRILQIPRIACINVHYGIPPHYRGNNTLFWPWYFGDFDNIGGSVHYINGGVDTGRVLAKVYPALEKKDGETELDLKTSQLLGVALIKVLRFIVVAGKLPLGLSQTEKGRNFKLAERTVRISLKAILLHKLGRLKPEPRNERMELFLSEFSEIVSHQPTDSAESMV